MTNVAEILRTIGKMSDSEVMDFAVKYVGGRQKYKNRAAAIKAIEDKKYRDERFKFVTGKDGSE